MDPALLQKHPYKPTITTLQDLNNSTNKAVLITADALGLLSNDPGPNMIAVHGVSRLTRGHE